MKKNIDQSQENRTYSMWFTCDNCGERFVVGFMFGKRARQGECPHCGCSPKEDIPFWMEARMLEEKKHL